MFVFLISRVPPPHSPPPTIYIYLYFMQCNVPQGGVHHLSLSVSVASEMAFWPPERALYCLGFQCICVYFCSFSPLYQLPPRDKSVSHSDSSVHLQALNPTQHWLDLLSSVLFISITMADSFEIKFTYVFLLFSNFFLEEEAKLYQFYAIKFGERGKKKGKVLDWVEKEYFRSQPNHNEILSDSGWRKLYRNKKSDVIIYHLKPKLFMRQKQNEILGWIHPELFNPKWLIPYKARADPSSVLINTLSLFLNRKTGRGKGMREKKLLSTVFLLCFKRRPSYSLRQNDKVFLVSWS